MHHTRLSMLVWFVTPPFVNAAGYDCVEYFMLKNIYSFLNLPFRVLIVVGQNRKQPSRREESVELLQELLDLLPLSDRRHYYNDVRISPIAIVSSPRSGDARKPCAAGSPPGLPFPPN